MPVADDEKRPISLVEAYLTQDGFEVASANDGRAALSLARDRKPDITILDLMMPEMDGYKFLRLPRIERDTTVIFLTVR